MNIHIIICKPEEKAKIKTKYPLVRFFLSASHVIMSERIIGNPIAGAITTMFSNILNWSLVHLRVLRQATAHPVPDICIYMYIFVYIHVYVGKCIFKYEHYIFTCKYISINKYTNIKYVIICT
jgi:hypothetical protein